MSSTNFAKPAKNKLSIRRLKNKENWPVRVFFLPLFMLEYLVLGLYFSGRIFLSKRKDRGSNPRGPAFATLKRGYGVVKPASSYVKAGRFVMFYVYSLKCRDGYYIGCTDNLKDRIDRHKKGYVKATLDRLPVKLEFYFAINDKYKAFESEKYLKSGSGRVFVKKHLSK